MTEIKKAFEDYLKKEYEETEKLLFNPPWYCGKPREMVDSTIQRCLGATMLVQYMDLPFADVNEIFEYYREKLEKLLDK